MEDSERSERVQVSGLVPQTDLDAAREASGVASNIDAVRYALRQVSRQEARGTAPEDIFASFRDLVRSNGGPVPVSIVDDQLAVLVRDGDGLLLGLDEDELMEVRQLPRPELLDRVEAEIRSRDDDELIDLIRESERERIELIAAALASERRVAPCSSNCTAGTPCLPTRRCCLTFWILRWTTVHAPAPAG